MGCDGEALTVVIVTVDARPTLQPANALDVVVSNDDDTRRVLFFRDSSSFPITFTVTPGGRRGDLHVDVTAIQESAGERTAVGHGSARVTIAPGRRSEASVLLEPGEFVVNATVAGDQVTSATLDGRNGQQLAVADDGSFVIGFASELDVVWDVHVRWFGRDARPARTGAAPDSDDLLVAQAGQRDPTVATAILEDRVALAWIVANDSPPRSELHAAVLTEDGLLASDIVAVTNGQRRELAGPAITALASGELLVTWLDRADDIATVRGRLLDADGVPAINPITDDDDAFDIGTVDAGTLLDAAAGGQGRAFMAAWVREGNLVARFFDADGRPEQENDAPVVLARRERGHVEGVRVAWRGDSAVAAWRVAAEADGTELPRSLLLGRFLAPMGMPVQEPMVLVPETLAEISVPNVALRADGSLAAVWHGCAAAGDGEGCGVFMQMADASDMAMGEPFLASTTTRGDQHDPAVGATDEAFIVVWTDHSAAPPDAEGGAVRARVVYVPVSL